MKKWNDSLLGLSRLAFASLWLVDHLIGTRKTEPFRKIRASLHGRVTRPTGAPNRFNRAAEVTLPFLTSAKLRELERGGPVVFKGLASGIPAMREWNFSALAERFGKQSLPCSRSGDDYYLRDSVVVSDLLRSFEKGSRSHVFYGGKGDLYGSDSRMREELSLNSWVDEKHFKKSLYQTHQLVFSGTGHWTPTHTEVGHILTVQVKGSRRWRMIAPSRSAELFPEISRAMVIHSHHYAKASQLAEESFGLEGWECVLEEGDVLFSPVYHWHYVETIEASISIVLRWMNFRSLVAHPVMSSLFLTARNPTVLGQLLKAGPQGLDEGTLTPLHLR